MSDFSVSDHLRKGNGQRKAPVGGRPEAMEMEVARLWLERAITETAELARYDRRGAVDVHAALRALRRLTALRGAAAVKEYREFLTLDPERTARMVDEQRTAERQERRALLAGFPVHGAKTAPESALESGPMEACL